ncbi:MAG: hypothetical protein HY820_15985 [Acidobacteria bacterium]|nr:hypothetical protein [Acidobacteriota bacterium]
MSSQQVHQQIPFYAADGTPMGYRSPESARRLLDLDLVSPAYGRKGHLKAIFARRRDGSSSVEQTVRGGTRYSYRERLESGPFAWKLKRLGKGDELRPIFLAVVTDCMASGGSI